MENQLKMVTKDGAVVATFKYDPLGRRVEKIAGGITYSFLYDGMDILRETRSDGTIYTYVHGPGIDEPLARIDQAGTVAYYHADGLGSIVKMTGSAVSVIASRQYDAWGNLEVGADQSGYAFTGREWDPETGLYYYRARYYDPKVGRFISEDPIGITDSVNSYSYVGANPITRFDPTGLAYLVTDMAAGTTTFYPWPESIEAPFTIETRSAVASSSNPGADSGFVVDGADVRQRFVGNQSAYGSNGAYIDTGDPRGRDIHGGGSGLANPYASRQGWQPTKGCTRGQNEDVQMLGAVITSFRQRFPNASITYIRSQGNAPNFFAPPRTGSPQSLPPSSSMPWWLINMMFRMRYGR